MIGRGKAVRFNFPSLKLFLGKGNVLSMRFLLTADLQLRNFSEFAFVTDQGYNSRLLGLLDGLTTIIKTHGPFDRVVIAGDLFNNKSSLETDLLDLTHRTFASWSEKGLVEKTILLIGNHDVAFLSEKINSLSQFSAAPFIKVISEPQVYDGVAYSPWRPSLAQVEADITKLSESGAKYLVGHWAVLGASTSNTVFETGIDPFFEPLKKFSRVLLGDVHRSQELGANIRYLGSAQQNDFSEEGEQKLVWILDDEAETLTPVETYYPEFRTVGTIEQAEEYRKKGYFVRLRATNREDVLAGTRLGVRVEADFNESVAAADSVRGLVSSLEEAVEVYAIANEREDLLEPGLEYLRGALGGRTVPTSKLEFKRLQADNFLAYAELDIDLSKGNGLTLVHGDVVSDASYDSNGAGKTAIFESIYYGLYGVTLRYGLKRDSTIRDGQKKNRVELDLDVRSATGEITSIKITRNRPGTTKLFINGEDATRTDSALTQDAINSIVGDPEFFLRLSLLALHYHPSFLKLADPAKKLFLDQFSGLEVFSVARDAVSLDASRGDMDINRFEIDEKLFETREILLADSVEKAKADLNAFTEREAQALAERQGRIKSLETELTSLKKPVAPILPTDYEKPVPPVGLGLSEKVHEDEAKELEDILKEAQSQLNKLREAKFAQLKPYDDTFAVINNEIRKTTPLTKIAGRPSAATECPTCKRPFENAEELRRHQAEVAADEAKAKKEAERALALLEKELNECQAARIKLVTGLASEITELEKDIRLVESELKAKNAASRELAKVRADYNLALSRAEITFNSKVNSLKAAYETAKSTYALQAQRVIDSIATLKAVKPGDDEHLKRRLKVSESEFAALGKAKAELAIRGTELRKRKADLDFWLRGFGNRGCKSLLYTSLIDRLNDELRKICNSISGGALQLRILPYCENAKGDQVEKISLEATNFLGASTFEGDSLGEQNRIDIAISLALRRTLTQFSGYSSSLLFCDEPWVGLDNSGKKSVYSVLEEEAASCLILVTDQDKASKSFANSDTTWVVRKENGISSLILN